MHLRTAAGLLAGAFLCVGLSLPRAAIGAAEPSPVFGSCGLMELDGLAPGEQLARATPIALAGLPDDSVLVLLANSYHLQIVRLLPDGTPDGSFGFDGWAHATAVATVMKVLPDRGFVTAGPGLDARDVVVARYTADGDRDTSWGPDGHVRIRMPYSAQGVDLAVDAHGTVVVASSTSRGWVVLRVGPGGALDTTFGQDGFALVPRDHPGPARVAPQPDGKIVVSSRMDGFALARLTATGQIDEAFGTAGYASLPLEHQARLIDFKGVAIDPLGRVVTVGVSRIEKETFLARHDPDGEPDTTFGTGAQSSGRARSTCSTSPSSRTAPSSFPASSGRRAHGRSGWSVTPQRELWIPRSAPLRA